MTNSDSLQTQIDDLQSRLSHQEALLDTLNDIVTEQDARIHALQLKLKQEQKKLEEAIFNQGQLPDQKPPHY